MTVATKQGKTPELEEAARALAVPDEGAHSHEVAEQLHRLLATSYRVFNSTQVAHWNVEGASFVSLHELFQKQYENLFHAIDEIAERIRALGFLVNGGLTDLISFAAPQPEPVTGSAQRLLQNLIRQHHQAITEIRLILLTARDSEDEATADLLTRRLAWHEDATWMIRSLLGKPSSTIRESPGFTEEE